MAEAVKITISQVCDAVRPAILAALAGMAEPRQLERGAAMPVVALSKGQGVKEKAIALLEKALAGTGYVVAENTQDESEIAVLREGDIEQLGLYMCSFCATIFRSELERDAHQRSHFFGFG
jgi:hypothetical protein